MSDDASIAGTIVPPEGFIPGKNGGVLRRWQPGQTGNPSGLSSDGKYHEVRKICADNSLKAILKQVELIDDPDPRIAFLATEAVLKRGVGVARDHSNEKPMRVDLSALSEDQRKSLAEMLRLMFGGG
jgi:hypothetical protein